MKIIPFLLLFLVFIGCNSPPIEPIDDKPPTEHTVPKEKQPDEKPVERREPPPIDKREVVPEDGGNEQIPDKTIPSCPANGLRITSINGTGSAREPSEVPSSLTDVRKATNRLQDKLVVTGSGLSKVSRVEIKELKTTLMMTVTKDTEMTIQLSRGLGLKAGLYTLLFYLSTTSVCSAQVFLLQGEGFTKEQQQAVKTLKSQQTQIAALLKLVKVNGKDVTIQADAFKVSNGVKDILDVDTNGDGNVTFDSRKTTVKGDGFITNVKTMTVTSGGKDYFKVDTDAKKANFDGLNVQITNGTNQTDNTNGVGNLLIGYNTIRSGTNPSRTGSHNLVIGDGHEFTSFAGMVSGANNTISGTASLSLGGQFNTSSGQYAVALGGGGTSLGDGLKAKGDYSVITGGTGNTVSGSSSVITGGTGNTVSGSSSVIVGGDKNEITGNVTGSMITTSSSCGICQAPKSSKFDKVFTQKCNSLIEGEKTTSASGVCRK